MLKRIDIKIQYETFQKEILSAIKNVLESGAYTLNSETKSFETEFSEYLGVSHTVGVSDGTRAISIALKVVGVSAGDEVITTAFTAVPTIGAILELGATPVFADVNLDTYLIDEASILHCVTEKTKAILPVHIFGNVFDVERLRKKLPRIIPIVEDSAQAHGSKINEKFAGCAGDLATFSFYPTKNLGGYGDGGAIVTNNSMYSERIKWLRNHGMTDKDTCVEFGFNSRLDEIQAAILRVKLPFLDKMNSLRGEISNRYSNELPRDLLIEQKIPENVQSNWHIYQSRCVNNRDSLVGYLEELNIQTNIYYVIPHHLQSGFAFLGYQEGDLPQTEKLCKQGIALPMYPELSANNSVKVIQAIQNYADRL